MFIGLMFVFYLFMAILYLTRILRNIITSLIQRKRRTQTLQIRVEEGEEMCVKC